MKRTIGILVCVVLLSTGARAADDTIPVSQIVFVGPGGNLGAWPSTTTISRVDIRLNGVEVTFDKRDGPQRWPDNTTPGWAGPLQYSLGLVFKLNGQWYASAPIETWYGANVIGGPIQEPGQIPNNWFYDPRWTPLTGYQPRVGEQFGLFVVAGDARNNYNPVKERSNIVTLTMPAPGTTASVTFVSAPPPPPPPLPPSPPPPSPPDTIDDRLVAIQVQIAAVHTEVMGVRTSLEAHRAAERAFLDKVGGFFKDPKTILAILGILGGRFAIP